MKEALTKVPSQGHWEPTICWGGYPESSKLLLAITENIKRIKSYFLLHSGPNCSYISMQKLQCHLRKLSLFS